LGSWIIGKTANFVIENYLKRFAQKTSSKLDDAIIEALRGPLVAAALLAGFYFGFSNTTLIDAATKAFLFNIIQTLFLLDLAWFLIRIFDAVVKLFLVPLAQKSASKLDDQMIGIVSKVGKILILIIVIAVILSESGYDVTALIAGLGIGGVALAFAAQATIADVFGGLSIFTSKPFVIGDYIEFGSVQGTVKEIGVRYTRLEDPNGRIITIPNTTITKENVIDWTTEPSRRVVVNLGLVYGTSAKKIEEAQEILREIVRSNPNCEEKTYLSFNQYKDSSLNVLLIYFVKVSDTEDRYQRMLETQNAVNLEIKKRFEKAKIGFAYPTQTVYLAK
jgi:MscS family membrane protein